MKYYFIGIGGAGMGPLASILNSKGHDVLGSDRNDSDMTRELSAEGIKVFIGHDENNLPDDVETVVVTVAVPKENPEVKKAEKLGIKIIKRSELLGELMLQSKGLAVSGTHGKTTTSSLLTWALAVAETDPTAVIGGNLQNFGQSFLAGKGDYFVAEACEYHRAFLDLRPFGAIITNIEADHLDYYKDLAEIVEAFSNFAGQIDEDGFLVTNGDSETCRRMVQNAQAKVMLVGYGDGNDFIINDVRITPQGTSFKVRDKEGKVTELLVSLFGEHNAFNGAMVFAAFQYLGLGEEALKKAFSSFKGAKRRLELVSENPLIYDDYAHHPTEVAATLKTLKLIYPDKNICCIFEPHQYSRTHFFLDDFARALALAETVIIPSIYEARDSQEDKESVSAEDLARKVSEHGGHGIHVSGEELLDFVLDSHVGDVVVTMGAGNVWQIAYKLKERMGA